MTRPLVSVVILNYKRLHELAKCLDSALGQTYENLEILVVDNHSQEDVAGLVCSRSPAIRLIELPENLGPCGGRNAGIRQARGEILITIDNDVTFSSPREVANVVRAFEQHPGVHVLAFRICDAQTGILRLREWCHPRDWSEFSNLEFETSYFGEGASAFRREVFESAGLYWERLFIGNEGYELGLRLLDKGYRILYCPLVSVSHSMSEETRSKGRAFYFYTRNYIWIAYKNYGFGRGVLYLTPKLLMMLLFSLRALDPLPFLRGLWEGVKGLKRIGPRTPISSGTFEYMDELERYRPGWLRRLTRHRLETQI